MNIKKILKLTFSVIIVVIIGFLIYDNYYVLTIFLRKILSAEHKANVI